MEVSRPSWWNTLPRILLTSAVNSTVTGAGLSEHIREAYGFLAVNYEPGDEIFLTGFSRGAFTARSVAGLIAAAGLLTRPGLVDLHPIFKDWENQLDDSYVSQWPDKPYPNHPKFLDPQYVVQLEKVYIHAAIYNCNEVADALYSVD